LLALVSAPAAADRDAPHGKTHQSLRKHCGSLPAGGRVRPNAFLVEPFNDRSGRIFGAPNPSHELAS
jgi:hypothetical protein